MSAGRCAGCGYVSSSCKLVASHMASCAELAKLYRTDPARVLPAEEEYRRWKEQEDPEVKAAARDEWLNRRFQDLDQRREAQATRWQAKDILDED